MKQVITTAKRLSFVVVALLLAAAIAMFAFSALPRAYADESEYLNWSQSVTVSNAQFGETGSDNSPSSWTGATIEGATASPVKSGVLQTATYSMDTDSFGLKKYAEYAKNKPKSPFGRVTDPTAPGYYEGTNTNVLLINSDGVAAAYGYSSSALSLSADSFYEFSVFTKTGDIGNGAGASFVLTGAGEDEIGFTGIATENLTGGMDGWYEYKIYLATDYVAPTVNINLQLGSSRAGGSSKGYAMFDNVRVNQISSRAFFSAVDSERVQVNNLIGGDYLDGGDFENGFAAFGEVRSAAATKAVILDAAGDGLDSENIYGLDTQLYAPNEYGGTQNNVFAVSTYNGTDFVDGYGEITSNAFTLDRYAHYRLSFWYYCESVEGGDGVRATLTYKSALNTGDYPDPDSNNTASSLTIASNPAHNGWNVGSVFVKGSDLADYTARFTLGLGSRTNTSRGVVMFDDVKIEKITPADYTANSANGNKAITIDSASTSTGITNGNFNTVGEYEEIEYAEDGTLASPLTPSSWTRHTVSSAATAGYSLTEVDSADAKGGLLPVEQITDVRGFDQLYGNVLAMIADEETVFGYAGESFTVAADSYATLSVKLFTHNIGGYGAALVLKRDGGVVSTIEQITNSGTYSFYIKGGAAESTMTVELWLGYLDHISNRTKRASGEVYFTEVTLDTTTLTSGTFDERAEAHTINRALPYVRAGMSFAAVDLSANGFTLFDSYTSGSVKYPYNLTFTKGSGTVNYGIFDAKSREDTVIPVSYDNKGEQYAIMLHNVTETYSSLTFNDAYTLTADSYYRLTVSVKADIDEQYYDNDRAVGGYIMLNGNEDYRFDFKDTALVTDSIRDDEAFVTYTFYIKTESAEASATLSVGLGGSAKSNQAIAGKIYVNNVTLETTTNLSYDSAVEDLDDDESMIDDYSMRVVFVSADETTDETTDETDGTTEPTNESVEWWLIPSILMAVAVIIAIVGSFIRKRIEARPKRTKTSRIAEYDRNAVAKATPASKPVKDGDDQILTPEDDFARFDDDGTDTVEAVEVVRERAPEPKTEATDSPVESTETVEDGEVEDEKKSADEKKDEKKDGAFVDDFDD